MFIYYSFYFIFNVSTITLVFFIIKLASESKSITPITYVLKGNIFETSQFLRKIKDFFVEK